MIVRAPLGYIVLQADMLGFCERQRIAQLHSKRILLHLTTSRTGFAAQNSTLIILEGKQAPAQDPSAAAAHHAVSHSSKSAWLHSSIAHLGTHKSAHLENMHHANCSPRTLRHSNNITQSLREFLFLIGEFKSRHALSSTPLPTVPRVIIFHSF